ncbi:IS110 family transposase [Rhodococcus sp. KBS0724]|uniref:IS110 family transposase n=1 Tax=Rhodococcus sp. KBS0724 TaxID=1179674 RepID=UPI00110F02A9|nr:IS110 family transposase [Rhodococcus sp. KBS0724]TSD39679.1 IS110 family transposase [Rhodococcus sp. KBS0724]TSD40334.1 IS110 family transposase [Rhodococcus sp. KBS0724]TSD40384.1 IS110 family transposase [Rhodococcus sp. KBS0724]TSD47487.1 IS110 family transposase [Rhodococcus sp. KBS0724]
MATTTAVDTTKSGDVVVGIDTHKYVHVGAVFDTTAGLLSTISVPADSHGFIQLLSWAESFGQPIAFGIEGTGSYGGALTSFIRRRGYRVIEVARPDRRIRRLVGKSDTIDAQNAAKAVMAGFATAEPKTADGTVEMIRQLKVAHDTAVKARATTMVTLKAMLVHAPEVLRAEMAGKTQITLARHCAALTVEHLDSPDDSMQITLATLAHRWLMLDHEAAELNEHIERLVKTTAPQLVQSYGIGTDTAAEILIVFGDNPERIKSEAALAKLAGISPIPASSGTTTGKYRINHGGHRQLNAAIYRTVIVRMRFHEPTKIYVARRTAEGKAKRDIIRCLKRYVIREVYHLVNNPVTSANAI